MVRLILIIASVLTLVGIILGVMNRNTFIATRNDKDKENKSTIDLLKQANDKIDLISDVHTESKTTESAEVDAEEAKKNTDSKIAGVESQIQDRENKVKLAQTQIDEMLNVIKPYEEQGINMENLRDKLAEMERTVQDKDEEVNVLNKEIELANNAIEANNNSITGYREAQSRRSQKISLNGSQATITAVNNEWGFVIINAGKNRGVPADAELLVKRGAENIGKLKIVAIEQNMLVANIDQGSLRSGARVLPGDQVVFEANVN